MIGCGAAVSTNRKQSRCLRVVLLLWLMLPGLPSLVLGASGRSSPPRVLDLALIVGNNRHLLDPTRTLHFADDDALRTAEALGMLHPNGQVWLLVRPDAETRGARPDLDGQRFSPPTRAAWDQAITEMQGQIVQARAEGVVEVRVFLHFAGHGEPGGRLHLEDQFLDDAAFRQSLGRLEADRVFALLDGCHLASLMTRGPEGEKPGQQELNIFEYKELAVPSRPRWLGMVSATTVVQEHGYLGAGLLSLVGTTALAGPADLNNDGQIRFSEWSRYVHGLLSSMPGGPSVVSIPPLADPLAVMVDLDQAHMGGIVLPRRFPAGQIRILSSSSGSLIAELYHSGHRQTRLLLPPGSYRVLRMIAPRGWQYSGLPAEALEVAVGDTLIQLDARASPQSVVLLPRGSIERGDVPQDVALIFISLEEFLALQNSPSHQGAPPGGFRAPECWSVSLRAIDPRMGPTLDLEQTPRPGAMLEVSYLAPVFSRHRSFTLIGLALQYGVQLEPDAWVDATTVTPLALRHTLRIGPTLRRLWAFRPLALEALGTLSYAPGMWTDSKGRLLRAWADSGTWQYFYPANGSGELGLALRFPWGADHEVGPVARVELTRFRITAAADLQSQHVFWVPQVTFGIEVRQRFYSGRWQ